MDPTRRIVACCLVSLLGPICAAAGAAPGRSPGPDPAGVGVRAQDSDPLGPIVSLRERLSQARQAHRSGRFAEGRRELLVAAEESFALLEARRDDLALGLLEFLARHAEDMQEHALARRAFGLLVEICERDHADSSPGLRYTLHELALSMLRIGEHAEARALLERVLALTEAAEPRDEAGLQEIRSHLGALLYRMGDGAGARALYESVLAAYERTLPEDHGLLDGARGNLAVVLGSLGEHAAARALGEAVLADRERSLPADHPRVLAARGNLALSLMALGELQAAEEQLVAVHAARERILPPGHPELETSRLALAALRLERGALPAARELAEAVLASRLRVLPASDRSVLDAARVTIEILAVELERARRGGLALPEADLRRLVELGLFLARSSVDAARGAVVTGSAREAEARAAALQDALDWTLSLPGILGQEGSYGELEQAGFELSESTRGVGLAVAALARGARESDEHHELRIELRRAGTHLAQLVQAGGSTVDYHLARQRREELERRLALLSRELAGAGQGQLTFDTEALVRRLPEGTAAVAFRRYGRRGAAVLQRGAAEAQDAPRAQGLPVDAGLCAFVLARGAGEGMPHLARVELGPAATIERTVERWRAAIGSRTERGLATEDGSGDELLASGRELRRLVLDPCLAAAGAVERLILVLDDVLHLVPFDALPLDGDLGCVGERFALEMRSTLWELDSELRPRSAGGALVSLGGAAFNSAPAALGEQELDVLDPGGQYALVQARAMRGGPWERGFAPLTYAGLEAREVAALFEERFEDEGRALVLERRRASRAALEEAAPRARWLHVATHGWFAPESARSWTDAGSDAAQETLRGMSPMLLAGLALAGANLGPDALGRIPGLITAEELSTLDLSGCELAVLSACDTNVGLRRAGQGVASLQKALHMAGARSAITALWKVPDEATRELMLDFYRRLWVDGKSKHQSLWEAKQRLRNAVDEHGRPLYSLRDWAAWVLTGEQG